MAPSPTKAHSDLLADEENLKKLAQLIRVFFNLGGHHVQFNVVSADLLRSAKAPPEISKISWCAWLATATIS